MNILIVDDCVEGDVALSRALQLHIDQANITTCTSAVLAIQLFRAQSWDFVLLDMMMYPGDLMDQDEAYGGYTTGLVLLRELAATSKRVPVGIVTALQGELLEAVRAKCSANPDVRFILSKPCKTRDLVQSICAAIRES